MEPILKIQGLSKKFEGMYALKNIDLSLNKGEIHGIIGANGSGKSTLMGILMGSKHIQETGGYVGTIILDGKEINHKTPIEAFNNGLGMVHQEFALFNDLSVARNIRINRESTSKWTDRVGGKKFSLVDKKDNNHRVKEALKKVGSEVHPETKIKDITTNMKQFVEIAREIDRDDIKILMLDEPTASLNQEDTSLLLRQLRVIADTGVAVIFVSHRLEEVMEISDKVTVLRDGEVVSSYNREDMQIDTLSQDMIGMEIVLANNRKETLDEAPIVTFENTSVIRGDKVYKNELLSIKKGEILGITGLSGHGQEIFTYGLMGLYKMTGDIYVNGNKISPGNTKSACNNGVYILPEERKELGIMAEKPVWENMVFGTYNNNKDFLKFPMLQELSFLNHKNIHRYCNNLVQDLNIKINDINQPMKELSGGNQQKVCIGRAMTMDPKVLFIGEPTRGVDIYSKEIILDMLLDMNLNRGVTVVISSGEVSELKRICDRIVVMYHGQIFDIFDKSVDSKTLNLAILGRRDGRD